MGPRPQSILAAAFFLLLPGSLLAEDFFMSTTGARSNALGGTYFVSSSDAMDSLLANPAGLSYLRGRNLNVVAGTVFARGSNSMNVALPLRNSAGLVPSGAFGMPIDHSRWSFGVGMMPDLLSNGDWRQRDAHANDPVPNSTLTPLTAAIMTNQVTGGFGYTHGRSRWEVSYSIHPASSESGGQSRLLSGESNNSTVHVGTQSVLVGDSFKF